MKISREALTKALNKRRFAWVDMVMKDELPPEVYGRMHSTDPLDKGRAASWLKERGYRVVDLGDGVTQVLRGTTLVSQTKLVLELDQAEDLLAVAETVTENVNIPPPPWKTI